MTAEQPAEAGQENPPAPLAAPAEAPLAEPPEGAVFTEVPPESDVPPPAPTAPPAPPVPSAAAEPSSTAEQPSAPAAAAPKEIPPRTKPAKRPRGPLLPVLVAVAVFIVLAAAAYYAYTKST